MNASPVAHPPASPDTASFGLARAAATGDAEAIARLLRQIAPRVSATVAAVMGRGHADLDDVTQQALIAFLQALPAFRGDCHPASYASRIALRAAVRARQRARRRQQRHEVTDDLDRHACTGASPGESASAAQRRAIVRAMLDELPEEQAESLALRVMLGCSLEEVAVATGAPVNTVRSRIRLAKGALRRRLEQYPDLALDDEPPGSSP